MAVKDVKGPRKDVAPKTNSKTSGPASSNLYKDEKPSPFSIEGIRSGAVQSNLVKIFLVTSGVIMAGGVFISSLSNSGRNGQQPGVPTEAAVAQVGNQTISGIQLARVFEQQQNMMAMYGQKTTAASYFGAKQGVLKQLTDNAANIEAAKAAGISVTEAEIDKKIEDSIAEQMKPQPGQSEAAFRRMIEARYGSMDVARDETRKNIDRNAVRDSLLVDKLKKQIEDANKVTEDDYKKSLTKLDLREIVIQAQPPKIDPKSKAPQVTPAVLAEQKAAKVLAQLNKKPTAENFAALAKTNSDDAATKAKGGELGWKLPSEYASYGPDWQESLANAKGKIVGPLKDPMGGQYIFFIQNRKTELPKDYAKDKKKLLTAFETQSDDAVWTKKQTEYQKAVTPSISDPALSAYQVQTGPDLYTKTPEEQKKMREDAAARYGEAAGNAQGMEAAAIYYQQAQLYRDLNQPALHLEALKKAVDSGGDADLRLEYARALREGGNNKEAIEQLKLASKYLDDNPSTPSMFGGGDPGAAVRQQISSEFSLLKQPQLAASEIKKIPKAPAQPGGMGGLPPGIKLSPAH